MLNYLYMFSQGLPTSVLPAASSFEVLSGARRVLFGIWNLLSTRGTREAGGPRALVTCSVSNVPGADNQNGQAVMSGHVWFVIRSGGDTGAVIHLSIPPYYASSLAQYIHTQS